MKTPWGNTTGYDNLINGVYQVYTASHGGLMIDKNIAESKLSKQALEVAIKSKQHYFFEEDCDISIPIYEMPELFKAYQFENETESMTRIKNSIKSYNTDYLTERSIIL